MKKFFQDEKKMYIMYCCTMFVLFFGRYYQIPLFLSLFPVFGILFLRHSRLIKGFLFLFIGSLSVILITFLGISEVMFSSIITFMIVMSISVIIGLIPIVLDAYLFKKGMHQLTLICIYPCLKICLEYVSSLNSPFGIWGSQASLLSDCEPFNNVVSFGGIWLLSLLVAILSSITVYIIQNGIKNPKSIWLLLSYSTILIFIYFLSWTRINKYKYQTTVKVATVLANDSLRLMPVNKMYLVLTKKIKYDSIKEKYIRNAFRTSNLDLIRLTEKAAQKGAKIIFWGEGNGVVLKKDEQSLINSVALISKKHKVYIGLALEVYSPSAAKPVENKITLIKPNGAVAFQYYKRYPIGIEKELMVKGNGKINTCTTPYGKISCVICFDTDFINYINKVGKENTDILFAPSNDWKSISELRGKITRYRALENGFTLVRPTSHGATEIVSPTGKLILYNNYFNNPLRLLIADVPSKHIVTFYSKFGDFLPLLLLVLLTYIILKFYSNLKNKKIVLNLLLISLAFCFNTNSYGQEKNIDSEKKIKLKKNIFLPVISYAPETKVAFGGSAIHFYNKSINQNFSQASITSIYTLNNQFINEINWSHYNKKDTYLIKGIVSVNKFPEKFFGIGNKLVNIPSEIVTINTIKTDVLLLKHILKKGFVGIRYNYANYYNIKSSNNQSQFLDTLLGGRGNRKSGVGVGLLYDSRDNINSTSHGLLMYFDATWNESFFGSSNEYFEFNSDIRKFYQVDSKSILGFQSILNIKVGNVPFSQLSYLGGNTIMRGFYAGQFRDKDLIAFQTEYRRHIIGNWGVVLFAGAGKVSSSSNEIDFKELQHSLGFGFRRMIDQQHKLNLRIDVGYGNGQSNFYLNLGESF